MNHEGSGSGEGVEEGGGRAVEADVVVGTALVLKEGIVTDSMVGLGEEQVV